MLITTEGIDIIKRERVSSAANTSASRSPNLLVESAQQDRRRSSTLVLAASCWGKFLYFKFEIISFQEEDRRVTFHQLFST